MGKAASRLASVDIFRGMTVAFMIIVNTPGTWSHVYSPLIHSSWHGCTPTDLVFPSFLFIAGIAMWYSLKRYNHELNSRSLFRILRRTVALFALGLFLAIFPYFGRDYSTLRIMGVLQRIALAYMIGSILCLTVKSDFLWILITVILIIYWILLAIFGDADPYSLEGNLVRKIDLAVLGKDHLYKGFGIPFDPEGLLSTLPAVCTILYGFYIGRLTEKGAAIGNTVIKMLLIGIALAGLGLLWNMFFPINKPLWTSSYVLFTAGIATIVFALIFLFTDVIKFDKWGKFFSVFGTNAILSFILAGIWTKMLLFLMIPAADGRISLHNWFYVKACVPVAGEKGGSLMFAIIQMMLIWLVALILYRKKVSIRL
jgi:predicted acyltransferase